MLSWGLVILRIQYHRKSNGRCKLSFPVTMLIRKVEQDLIIQLSNRDNMWQITCIHKRYVISHVSTNIINANCWMSLKIIFSCLFRIYKLGLYPLFFSTFLRSTIDFICTYMRDSVSFVNTCDLPHIYTIKKLYY